MATVYYIAKEPCYFEGRLLTAGEGIDHDFGKGKVPPYLRPGKRPEVEEEVDAQPSDLSAAERAELDRLRAEVEELRKQVKNKDPEKAS
jgi:hypothetical protein